MLPHAVVIKQSRSCELGKGTKDLTVMGVRSCFCFPHFPLGGIESGDSTY